MGSGFPIRSFSDLKSAFDVVDFIKKMASLLQSNVQLFQRFLGIIPVEQAKVVYSVDGNSIDLITIKSSLRGVIYPISHASQLDSPAIKSTDDIQSYLKAEETPWGIFTSLPSRWAASVAELLQMVLSAHVVKLPLPHLLQELDVLSDDVTYRRRCLTCLRKLALQYGVLPDCFFLSDVVCNDRHPVSVGGFAVRISF